MCDWDGSSPKITAINAAEGERIFERATKNVPETMDLR